MRVRPLLQRPMMRTPEEMDIYTEIVSETAPMSRYQYLLLQLQIRRGSSFRRHGSSRRSRSTPAADAILSGEEGIASHRGSRKAPPKDYEPGLRSMLYGLHQRQEKEEAEMKKRQKKQLGK
nr:hypothetical protein HCOI_02131100 [Haemonchus contortus]